MSYYTDVYKVVKKVPKGKVTTYGSIAKKLGLSPRTVGHALHLNPDEDITPCHRVVNFKGRIAPGFAFGGIGVQKKKLEREGVKFKDGLHVDLKKYFVEA